MEATTLITLNTPPRFYRCEPGWSWAPFPLLDHDLWCVLDGEGTLRLDGQVFALSAGTAFVLPPGSRPRATQNSHRRLLVFYAHFAPSSDFPALPPPGHVVRDTAFFFDLAHRAEACFQRGDALGVWQSRLLVAQMLLQLCAEAAQPAPTLVDARVGQITAAIREEPGRAWPVNEQASRACLSRAQYTRRFRQITGLSPNAFVVRTRLERASQLVRETDMTLAAIAHALGYRDGFFFSRQFKQHFGVAPSTLRGKKATSAPAP